MGANLQGGLAAMMTVIRLRDPERRMARFHALALQAALPLTNHPCVDLCHEFGRIGCSGRVMVDQFANEDEARAAAARLLRLKRRKGYR
jgi:predicted DNA-binding WGR domain protein